MKPIKLTMEGFGPYLKETVVDFEELPAQLTLITGNTGAGKTTIFDGICCALFGETSGASRSFSQMRNESATAKDVTRVCFEFELNGNRYTVMRSPKYKREKKKGEGTTDVAARASLTRPDGSGVEGAKSVNEEVMSLLGIGRDEFRQIVMIAQNDFMAMLTDTDKDQEKIFYKVFNAKLFEDFGEMVRTDEKEAKSRLDDLIRQIRLAVDMLEIKDDIFQKMLEEENLNTSEIVEYLSLKENALEEDKPKLEERQQKAMAAVSDTEADIKTAAKLLKTFQESRNAQKRLTQLEGKRNEIRIMEAARDLAKKARDQVENPFNLFIDAQRKYDGFSKNRKNKAEEYKGATRS